MFAKSRQSDLEEIDSLATQYEQQVSDGFINQVKSLQSDESIKIIREYLEIGRIDLAEAYLEQQNENWFLLPLFFTIFGSAAALWTSLIQLSIIQRQKSLGITPNSQIVFDPTDPKIAELTRQIVQNIGSELSAKQRDAFRYIVLQGQLEGKDARKIASDFRLFAGLTDKQIQAVENYRKLLEDGSKQALNRLLRDKGFDAEISSGKPLSQKQIDDMVNAYRRNMLIYRAETIARTNTGDIINTAIENASKQALETAGIAGEQLVKAWRSMRDKKVRYTHSNHGGMDGQVVDIDADFISPSGARLKHPHDSSAPISETANCRCRMLVYLKPQNRNK